ncbi:MAG: 6-phosphogluconolactonase [Acidimicrobiia bacterium]|nr:MAG: 6-phosphogluconolactonase [Acidimicrobiia bacterium]
MEHLVFPSADHLATAAAAFIANEIATSDQVLLGLAGGSTPMATYRRLAAMPIDWNGVTSWMTDERWVSPRDADSNQAMVRESLDTIGRIRFLAPNTRLRYPTAAARRMTRSMGCLMNRRPSRSVTLLGMGDDGHTASLFPGTRALSIEGAVYVANWVPHLDTWRLTASLSMLAASDVVLFLVVGENKAEVVAQIAAGDDYPAGGVKAGERVLWMLDEGAASLL